ncbi:outer membrane beta-barrel protein [Helicobacter muridarum]|uniref:Helicobacter outer membrane protein n=1 Tax=Helicobacter muridarum TaxID=216 RepID=A0A099U1U3_9HELI|nr:outer membrane beta-barrel protein [Helicobacter muridarum]TLE00948.1 outer membrane beta-barrel protein [Helicobacter muridarum]STQ86732.1 Helicobacter outer membrane protein [Helicobacter muridarum]
MKKLLVAGLISFSLSASLAEARFFLGVEGGWGKGETTFENKVVKYGEFTNSKAMHGWLALLNIGGEWMFNEMIGMRTFLSLGYGQNYFVEKTFHDIELGINADMILDLYNNGSFSFGLFGGIGSGYNSTFEKFGFAGIIIGTNIPIYGRAGLTFGLGENSRVDLTTYLPIASYNVIGFKGGLGELSEGDINDLNKFGIAGAYNPIRFTLAYRYIF